jgi:hypothetical protein
MERNEKATLENHKKEKELGMGWHDFMVFCRGFTGVIGIIAGIVLAILSSIAFEPFAIAVSIATLALSVYSLEVKNSLSDFEEDAPKKLIRYHVISMIISIADAFSEFFIGPLESYDKVDTRSLISAIIHGIIMIAINSSYYAKRRHMFEDDEEE